MKKIYFYLFTVICCASISAQNEASFWYFGNNAGVRFNADNGSVTALTDGQLNTLEGCTTISDENGNLLFYTDGRSVWARNHQIMPNGNYNANTGLLGDPSSTSSGLIVPKPESTDEFYIFTVDEPHHENAAVYPNQKTGTYVEGGSVPQDDNGFNDGLNYSLVDMTVNNGFGDVSNAEKNVPLITYNPDDSEEIKYKCSEKITAVRADDCSSFWVITHFVDRFYAFKVDENGVNTTPVISTVGPTVPIQGYRRNALGYLKASPDGSKIVVAHYGFAQQNGENASGGVYLFDFNNNTGEITNTVELYSPQNNDSPYGVEFSAENKKVYATIGLGPAGNGASIVTQWDLESADVPASIQTIHSSNTISAGALQLAVNRKIYRAQFSFGTGAGQYLGVIENPEITGLAANYNETGLLLDVNGLNQNTSRIGLPPFIQSLFNSEIDIIRNGISSSELKLCTGDTYTLLADDIPTADYVWSKDGTIIPETGFELLVDEPGFYEVFIEPNNGDCPIIGTANVGVFDIPVANSVPDIIVCDDDNDGQSEFSFSNLDQQILPNPNDNDIVVDYFETEADAINNENNIQFPYTNSSNPQDIFVRVYNVNNPNCYDITNFSLTIFNTPTVATGESITFCDNYNDITDGVAEIDLSSIEGDLLGNQDTNLITLSYHSSASDANSNINPLPLSYINTNPFSETLYVRAENTNNPSCFTVNSITLTINPSPEVSNVSLLQCDEDGIPEGFTLFNLEESIQDITSLANADVQFFISEADAQNGTNALTNPTNFSNASNPQTLYTKVTDPMTGCFNFSELFLEVSVTASNDAMLELCDDDGTEDGFRNFTLTEANSTVLAGLPAGLNVTYYETYEEALTEQNALPNNFTNTIPISQTIFARVENNNACYGISELELNVLRLPELSEASTETYCLNSFPETINLSGGVVNDLSNNYLYEWSTGETTSEIQVNEPGTYNVRVTNSSGCFKERTINVVASNIATITAIDVVDASENNTITLNVAGEGDYEFALDNPNGPYQDSNVFNNLQPGIYKVYVRDINGCGITEDMVSVIGFPKFFTPNGDGTNDYWQVYGITDMFENNSEILIFDRFGKLLSTLDPNGQGWDGNYNGAKLPSSDYWFKVTLEDGRIFTSHFTLKR